MDNMWPLPFDEYVVIWDEMETGPPVVGEHPFNASPPKRGDSSTHARASSNRMKECKHLLPTSQCSWCLGIEESIEPHFERKDYVKTLAEQVRQGHDTEFEDDTYLVHPRELYGTQIVSRIRKTLERSE